MSFSSIPLQSHLDVGEIRRDDRWQCLLHLWLPLSHFQIARHVFKILWPAGKADPCLLLCKFVRFAHDRETDQSWFILMINRKIEKCFPWFTKSLDCKGHAKQAVLHLQVWRWISLSIKENTLAWLTKLESELSSQTRRACRSHLTRVSVFQQDLQLQWELRK